MMSIQQIEIVLWFAWAFVSALGLRILVTRLLRRPMGEAWARGTAYPICILIALAGILVGPGFPLYGFDQHNPQHVLGYALFFYAPWGLPLLAGTPMVLVADIIVAVGRALLGRPAAAPPKQAQRGPERQAQPQSWKRPEPKVQGARGEQFRAAVTEIFGPTLTLHGLTEWSFRNDPDDLYSALVFRSDALKLYLYDSVRDGEVNALVSPLWADDSGSTPDWVYLRTAAAESGPPKGIEELRRNVSREFVSNEDQLRGLAALFDAQYARVSSLIWHKARRDFFREGAPYRVMAATAGVGAFIAGEKITFVAARHSPYDSAYVCEFETADGANKTFWFYGDEPIEVASLLFELDIAAMPEYAVPVRWTERSAGPGYEVRFAPNRWWTLRLNNFPDEPAYTLFVNSQRVGDFSDWLKGWEKL
jgi:hypothetical protein